MLTTADTSWVIYDNRRNGFNETEQVLNPNLSGAEATYSTTGVDFLSNGFKSRGASVYAAFAEPLGAYAPATPPLADVYRCISRTGYPAPRFDTELDPSSEHV
jgi:hypothetical protein